VTETISIASAREEALSASWLPVMEAWLDRTANSPHTRAAYRGDVTAAMHEMGVRDLRELTGAILAAHRGRLVSLRTAPPPRRRAATTIARHLASLRSFLAFGCRTGACPRLTRDVLDEVLPIPPASRARAYAVLQPDEVHRLLAAASSARDRAMIGVLVSSAPRRAELADLDCADVVDQGDGLVIQIRGKGGRERVVPLAEDVAELVLVALGEEGRIPGEPGPLFLGGAGRLAPWEVRDIVHGTAKAAGLGDRVSPHALRHTAAKRVWDHTHDILAVQQLLGHAQIETTRKYLLSLTAGELRAAIPPLPTGG
jgi:integrase/recombinase XerC